MQSALQQLEKLQPTWFKRWFGRDLDLIRFGGQVN
jgi:hypothetical protein